MRFRRRLLDEEMQLLSTDGSAGSMSPTELGQYNARMLLSPSSGRARNAEVMRLERKGTLGLCECHPNGLKSPPLLDLASAGRAKAVLDAPGACDTGGFRCEEAVVLLEDELKQQDDDDVDGSHARSERNYTDSGLHAYSADDAAYKNAGLHAYSIAEVDVKEKRQQQCNHQQRQNVDRQANNGGSSSSSATSVTREIMDKLSRLQADIEQ